MDKDVADKLRALAVSTHLQAEAINSAVWDNIVESTGVIGNNLLQQMGGPSSVPGLIAAANSAARSPAQGML